MNLRFFVLENVRGQLNQTSGVCERVGKTADVVSELHLEVLMEGLEEVGVVFTVVLFGDARDFFVLHNTFVELLALEVKERVDLIDLRQLLAAISVQFNNQSLQVFGVLNQALPTLQPDLMLLSASRHLG